MNGKAKIALGVGVVAILGWSGLWFAGKGTVEERMDAELANLAVRGQTVTFSDRAISGFPFGYEMTLTDARVDLSDGAVSLQFPTLTTVVDASAPTKLVTTLPSTFVIETTTTHTGVDGASEKTLRSFDVETSTASITIDGRPGDEREVGISAGSLLISHTVPETDGQTALALELIEVEVSASLPIEGPARPREITVAGEIGGLDTALSTLADTADGASDERRVTMESQISGLQFTGGSTLRDADNLRDMMLGEGDHSLSANYVIGPTTTVIKVEGGEEPGGLLRSENGATSTVMSFDEGIMDLRGETRNMTWEIVPEDPEVKVRGKVGIEMLDAIYRVPFAPSEAMQNFDLKFAIVGLAPDEALWATFDPDAALDRTPATMTLDVDGSMRMTKPQSEVRPGEAQPFELGTVTINQLDVSALGANASADGAVEFLQPINLPQGEVEVRLSKAVETMSAMVQAKLLTPDILLVAGLLTNTYLKADPQTGELVGLVEMGPGGVTMNGQPLGLFGAQP